MSTSPTPPRTPTTTRAKFIAWAERFAEAIPEDARIHRSRIPGNLAVFAADGAYLGYGDPVLNAVDVTPTPEET